MKRISVLLLSLVLLASCAGLELKDDAIGNSTAYFAGKGMGVAIYEGAPESMKALESNYDAFMLRNAANEMVSPDEVMGLFNDSIAILTLEVADPYGLISDLTFLISQFGGQLIPVANENPILQGLQPIPLAVFKSFEWGYDSGKRIAAQL